MKETKISEEELSDRKAIVFAEEKDRFLRSHFAALLPGWRNLIRFSREVLVHPVIRLSWEVLSHPVIRLSWEVLSHPVIRLSREVLSHPVISLSREAPPHPVIRFL